MFSIYHFQFCNSPKKKCFQWLQYFPCISRLEEYVLKILTDLFTSCQQKVCFLLNSGPQYVKSPSLCKMRLKGWCGKCKKKNLSNVLYKLLSVSYQASAWWNFFLSFSLKKTQINKTNFEVVPPLMSADIVQTETMEQ